MTYTVTALPTRIMPIAVFTFREAVRNRLFRLTLAGMVCLLGLTEFIGDLAVTERAATQAALVGAGTAALLAGTAPKGEGVERGLLLEVLARTCIAADDLTLLGFLSELVQEDERALVLAAMALERKQVDRVQAVRAKRDTERVEAALQVVREQAATEQNLMPALLDCARAHCTEGEIIGALQDVWGAYTETPVF